MTAGNKQRAEKISAPVALIWAAAVLAALALFAKVRDAGGLYLHGTGVIWCTTEFSCLHEVGHHVDHLKGYPSQGRAFQAAVGRLAAQRHPHPRYIAAQNIILALPEGGLLAWGGYAELYADLYALHMWGVPLPPDLQPFYAGNQPARASRSRESSSQACRSSWMPEAQ
jgi:hypothetical protein